MNTHKGKIFFLYFSYVVTLHGILRTGVRDIPAEAAPFNRAGPEFNGFPFVFPDALVIHDMGVGGKIGIHLKYDPGFVALFITGKTTIANPIVDTMVLNIPDKKIPILAINPPAITNITSFFNRILPLVYLSSNASSEIISPPAA
jgi:hypothetical protein